MFARLGAAPGVLAGWVATIFIGASLLSVFDRGGNTAPSILFIGVCAAIALLAVATLLVRTRTSQLPRALAFWLLALTLLLLFTLITSISVPNSWWVNLPGRSAFSSVLETLADPAIGITALPVTLAPSRGLFSALLVASSLALSIAITQLNLRQRTVLLYTVVAIVVVQSLIGLAQIALPGASVVNIEYLGHVRAAGTFVNKNHFATLVAMALPFLLYQSVSSVQQMTRGVDRMRPLKITLWWSLFAGAFGALVLSLSRSGIFAALVSTGLMLSWILITRGRKKRSYRRALLAAAAVVLIGGTFLATSESFFKAVSDPGAAGSLAARTMMLKATLNGAATLFPLGSGIGGYAVAFPIFQPVELVGYIEHAHNDYAQLLFESGLVGVLSVICIAFAAWTIARMALKHEASGTGVAALCGALAFALHAALDFPARIPSLAMLVTILFTIAIVELTQSKPADAA